MLAIASAGCQAVLGDFRIDTSEPVTVLSAECRPDTYRCEGAQLETCADDRSGFRELELCASADQCDPTLGLCRPCVPGEYACNDGELLHCEGVGSWMNTDSCDTPELCVLGLTRLEGRCDPAVCTPEALRCGGADRSRFERCARSGERWELVERCASGEYCNATPSVPPSPDDVIGCLPAPCDPETDTCAAPTCENGTRRCKPGNVPVFERCNAEGAFVVDAVCSTSALCSAAVGSCLPPACETGETRCFGQSFRTCRSDLTRFAETERCAAGELCDPKDGCEAVTCQDDAWRCNGPVLERCGDGAWLPEHVCITKELCDAEAGVCNPPVCGGSLPSYHCDMDVIIEQCPPGRDNWTDIGTCSAGAEVCVDDPDFTRPKPFCVPL